ncbi:MAG: Ppx/GppA family phosphatase [Phycisphaerales bacterium]|nr:Ppx/GppA family phosphatase [Phycisphaerales bacterium]
MSSGAGSQPHRLRVAAIDVGTNSIRLVVAEVAPDRSFRLMDDEKVVARLGRNLAKTGRLSEEAIEAALLAIERMKTIAEGYGVARLRLAGTSAVREAENRDDLLARVRERTGLELEVISAREEARLAFLSVSNAFDLAGQTVGVMDVGGGSTEIVLSSGHIIERIFTLKLGAVRLTDQFNGVRTARDFRRMVEAVDERLEERVGRPPFAPPLLIGTGGTFTTLAAMSMQRGQEAARTGILPFPVRGYEMQRSEVSHLLDMLRRMEVRERARVSGLGADRADIIVAGLAIVDRVLRHLGANRLRVHDQGIREGLLHEMVAGMFPPAEPVAPTAHDRLRSVRQFALTCHYEKEHAEHVATLALRLFDQLPSLLDASHRDWAGPGERLLLEAAALLHDVGYFVNYSSHHKHSYHLILHSNLAGFSTRELELLANIARYHRGAMPRKKHDNFARLKKAEREAVRRLAAILRLAVGLDRSHTQRVRDLTLRRVENAIVIEVAAAQDVSVDLWGAERKADLFERAFGVAVRLEQRPSSAGAPLGAAVTPASRVSIEPKTTRPAMPEVPPHKARISHDR